MLLCSLWFPAARPRGLKLPPSFLPAWEARATELLKVEVTWQRTIGKPSAPSIYLPIVQSALGAVQMDTIQARSGTLREQKEAKVSSILWIPEDPGLGA